MYQRASVGEYIKIGESGPWIFHEEVSYLLMCVLADSRSDAIYVPVYIMCMYEYSGWVIHV